MTITNMETSTVLNDDAWGVYFIHVINMDTDEETFQVCKVVKGKGNIVNVEWATLEGATACAELLAEGYLKE